MRELLEKHGEWDMRLKSNRGRKRNMQLGHVFPQRESYSSFLCCVLLSIMRFTNLTNLQLNYVEF